MPEGEPDKDPPNQTPAASPPTVWIPGERHSPIEVASNLARKLSSRQRHVVFLTGAGTSRAVGMRDMAGLRDAIAEHAKRDGQDKVSNLLGDRNLEDALTWIRRLSSLLAKPEDSALGYSKNELDEADVYVRRKILALLSEAPDTTETHRRFATWAAHAEYTRPIEIFTLNYDLLFELEFDRAGVPYFDGFLGDYEGTFRADLVDSLGTERVMPAFFARIWKLHGSLSWGKNAKDEIIRSPKVVSESEVAAIHPSEAKYSDSRRSPYVILQDRLRRALLEPESLTLVAGYSLGDQHINEMVFDAIRARPRSEVVFLFHGEIHEKAREYALQYPNVTIMARAEAIVASRTAPWEPPTESKPSIWADGKFLLGDFNFLARFLAESAGSVEEEISES